MKRIIIKRIGSVVLAIAFIGLLTGLWMFFKPHRNVQATDAYAQLKVADLVNEFSNNPVKANAKYLASDGNSKVLIIEGRVDKITENQNKEKVVILKDEGAKVGVSATFTQLTSTNLAEVKAGDIVKVKGAITAGNRYDADLDIYEHAILIQCDIVK